LEHLHTSDNGDLDGHLDDVRHSDRNVKCNLNWVGDWAGYFNDLLNRHGKRAGDGNFERHTHGAGDLNKLFDGDAHGVGHGARYTHLHGESALDWVSTLDGNANRERDGVLDGDSHPIAHLPDDFVRDLDGVAAGYGDSDRNSAGDTNFVRYVNWNLNLNWDSDHNRDGDRHLNWSANFNRNWDRHLDLHRDADLYRDADRNTDWCAHLNGDRDRHSNLVWLRDGHGYRHRDSDRSANIHGDGYGDRNGPAHLDGDWHGDWHGNLVRDLVRDLTLDGNTDLDRDLDRDLVGLGNGNRYSIGTVDDLFRWDRDSDGGARDDGVRLSYHTAYHTT